jgi:hypothetical protein
LSPFFKDTEYLRIKDGPGKAAQAEPARRPVYEIKSNLTIAYRLAGNGAIERSGAYIGEARKAMTNLLDEGEKLAQAGIGIPFFEMWKSCGDQQF